MFACLLQGERHALPRPERPDPERPDPERQGRRWTFRFLHAPRGRADLALRVGAGPVRWFEVGASQTRLELGELAPASGRRVAGRLRLPEGFRPLVARYWVVSPSDPRCARVSLALALSRDGSFVVHGLPAGASELGFLLASESDRTLTGRVRLEGGALAESIPLREPKASQQAPRVPFPDPHAATPASGTLSLSLEDVPLGTLLRLIGSTSGATVTCPAELRARLVTVSYHEVPLIDALQDLAEAAGCKLVEHPDRLELVPVR